jgi:hypothetical protein
VVWATFKNKIKQVICGCCGREYELEDQNDETLSTFLATSFNVELVYIILEGITKFTNEVKAIEIGESCAENSQIKRKIDKSYIKLNSIKVKDPSIWDVMKTEDFVAPDHVDD